MTDPKVIAVHVKWRVTWTVPDNNAGVLPHEQTYGRFTEAEAKVQRPVAQRAGNIRWQRRK